MQAVFILNATMRNKTAFIKEVQEASKQYPEINIRLLETAYHNHAIALAEEAAKENVNFIIAVGGDGTLNQVINGALKVSSQIAVGLIPKGSGNDFARNFITNRKISSLFDAMKKNSVQHVDVGLTHFNDAHGDEQKRYFINVADVGMGAEVVQRVNMSSKKLGAQVTFMKAIVSTFLHFKKKIITVDSGHWQWRGEAMAVVAANGKYFAGGLGIAPDAALNDGLFHITILGKISIWDYIKNINRLRSLKKIRHKEVHYKEAELLTFNTEDKHCGLEADGEFFGYLPAKIQVIKNGLLFITGIKPD
jgi:diacylglycerol kinase (ATP)